LKSRIIRETDLIKALFQLFFPLETNSEKDLFGKYPNFKPVLSESAISVPSNKESF